MPRPRLSAAPRGPSSPCLAGLALRLAFGLGYWRDKPLTHDEREYLALARQPRRRPRLHVGPARRDAASARGSLRPRPGLPGVPRADRARSMPAARRAPCPPTIARAREGRAGGRRRAGRLVDRPASRRRAGGPRAARHRRHGSRPCTRRSCGSAPTRSARPSTSRSRWLLVLALGRVDRRRRAAPRTDSAGRLLAGVLAGPRRADPAGDVVRAAARRGCGSRGARRGAWARRCSLVAAGVDDRAVDAPQLGRVRPARARRVRGRRDVLDGQSPARHRRRRPRGQPRDQASPTTRLRARHPGLTPEADGAGVLPRGARVDRRRALATGRS